jgi:hypothetical protein
MRIHIPNPGHSVSAVLRLEKRRNKRSCPQAAARRELPGGFQFQSHGGEVELECSALLKHIHAEISVVVQFESCGPLSPATTLSRK